ncbi:MAG: branched-chain amino acid ABC transporter permease [Acidimicrobiia bacterium]|nr:branched-chain amino acid ABC transporter permease [Acidimicrobiia bacterium]
MTVGTDRSEAAPSGPESKGSLVRRFRADSRLARGGIWLAVIGLLAILVAVWPLARKALVFGLAEEAPLALAAVGFALLYRLTGLINVAYAETVTLGAYFGMWFNTTFGWNFYVSLIPAALGSGVLSVVTYFAFFRPAKRRNVGVVELIILSFGLSILLRYGLQLIFGHEQRYFKVPFQNPIKVFGLGVPPFRVTALAGVVAGALLLYWFIQKTRLGIQIRALAGDEKLAQVSGINPLAVTVLIWFIAGIAGGAAGAFYGVGATARPLLGWSKFLYILLAVLVGGSKGLRGVIIAGLGMGVLISGLTLAIQGQGLYAEILVVVLFMVILKVRGNRVSETGKV